jgi:5-methylcytosine-specific restriction endonuclease McrA
MAAQPTLLSFVCVQCRKPAERLYCGAGVRPTLCSSACKKRAYYARHKDRARDSSRRYEARLAAQRPPKAPRVQTLPAWKAKAAEASGMQKLALALTPCVDCGLSAGYGGMGRRRTRCTSCAALKRAEIRKTYGKAAKRRREARMRGAESELVHPNRVFDRDGWRCHMCGRKTPRRLRGTCSPTAPELDHIIPLARGGPHTYANTACSCRECNHRKGDKPLGQARLFG